MLASDAAVSASANGACTPAAAIAAPARAEPAATPDTSAETDQENASCSVPSSTVRPTSEYWQERAGAMARPASRLQAQAAGIDPATSSGSVSRQLAHSSAT